MLLGKIDQVLRRDATHEPFVNNNGLFAIYDWLVPMPDGTYPNKKIVMTLLQQLERFRLARDDLE